MFLVLGDRRIAGCAKTATYPFDDRVKTRGRHAIQITHAIDQRTQPHEILPILFIVVAGIAGLAAHYINNSFGIALIAGTQSVGEAIGDESHHRALFRVEHAAQRGQPFHRSSNRDDRRGHIAARAACDHFTEFLAHFGDCRTSSLADHYLQFAEVLCELCERVICGIAKRHGLNCFTRTTLDARRPVGNRAVNLDRAAILIDYVSQRHGG